MPRKLEGVRVKVRVCSEGTSTELDFSVEECLHTEQKMCFICGASPKMVMILYMLSYTSIILLKL